MKPLPQISHWNYQFIFHKLSRLSIIECYIPWTFFPQGLHGQNLHVLTNRFYCGKVCHILDMEALGAGVNLNAFSGQLQNSKILGHHSQMDIIYIWAKCCMLANQPERMSLFLWLLAVIEGTVHVLGPWNFNSWESTNLQPIWPNFMVLGGPGPDLWPLKLLP